MRDYLGEKFDRKAAQYGEGIGAGIFNVGWWVAKAIGRRFADQYLSPSPNADTAPSASAGYDRLQAWFEHTHLVAGSGFGKTQALQTAILRDLPNIAAGWKTTIVIDSQGDLIDKILHLEALNTPALSDRLILIDPHDVEMPPCLNLFDFGLKRLNTYDAVDRERLVNSATQMYEYIFGQLLGAEMTQRQSVVFQNLAQLLMAVPNATIFTLMGFLENPARVSKYLHKLDYPAQHFLTTQFFSSMFDNTRRQISIRLWGIVSKKTLGRMFAHPHNKVDMFTAMNNGSLILIKTAKDLLKQEGTELFGRFMIALISQATQERATISERERKATLVYIDEAHDYFDDDVVGLQQLLSQGRKYRVGLILAHQHLGQLPRKLRETVMASTANKLVGGLSQEDAEVFAKVFGATVEEMRTIPQKTKSHVDFIASLRNEMGRDRIELGLMERQPRMSHTDYLTLRLKNQQLYGARVDDRHIEEALRSAAAFTASEGSARAATGGGFALDDPGTL